LATSQNVVVVLRLFKTTRKMAPPEHPPARGHSYGLYGRFTRLFATMDLLTLIPFQLLKIFNFLTIKTRFCDVLQYGRFTTCIDTNLWHTG